MFSKPCGRAGCQGLVVRQNAYDLGRAMYCSRGCSMRVRIANGYQSWRAISTAARRRGGRRGGLVTAARRRHAIRLAVLTRLDRSISPQLREELTYRQLTAVRALMSLAYQHGQAIERKRWKDTRGRLARERKAAA